MMVLNVVCIYTQVASLSQTDYGLLTAHSTVRGLHVIVLRWYIVDIIAICGLVKSVFAQTQLLCSQKPTADVHEHDERALWCMYVIHYFLYHVCLPTIHCFQPS